MEFSKKICVFSMALVCAALLISYHLAWNEKPPLSDVAIAVIGTFGGFVTSGYFTLQGVRHCSLNKHAHKEKKREEPQ